MSLLTYKYLAGFFILITSLLAVSYPIKIRAYPSHHPLLELGDAFASGIFLGAALFHMLPEAATIFHRIFPQTEYPLSELFCASGFIFLLLLERLSQVLPQRMKNAAILPCLIALILIIHSLIEGAALGFNTDFASAFIIFIAIIVHKSSESFVLAVILNRSTFRLSLIICIVGVFSLMTPIGIILGTTLTAQINQGISALLTAGFNAFAAGTFLYMSTLHHINHHKTTHDTETLVEFFFILVGLIIMAVLAWWV